MVKTRDPGIDELVFGEVGLGVELSSFGQAVGKLGVGSEFDNSIG